VPAGEMVAAVEAGMLLELGQAAPQRRWERGALDAEQVGSEALVFEVDAVDAGHHAGPAQLGEGAEQGGQSKEVVAGAGAESHEASAGSVQGWGG
jgi:hypothetical protein